MSANTAQVLQNLYQKYGQLEGVQIELHKDLIAIAIVNDHCSGRVFLQGAQVTEFQPKNQAPVLWSSDANLYQLGKPIRGGIPISWPWFADFDKNPEGLRSQYEFNSQPPAHGFARDQQWTVQEVTAHPDMTRVRLSLEPEYAGFTRAVSLQLTVEFGAQLELNLSVHNHSQSALTYTVALHSYFAISSPQAVQIPGLAGCTYLDAIDGWQPKEYADLAPITTEVDAVFPAAPDQISLLDSGFAREIKIGHINLPSLVMWNPWIDKGSRLSQFNADDYQAMLCLENAALLANASICAPGQNQQHTCTIAAVPLA